MGGQVGIVVSKAEADAIKKGSSIKQSVFHSTRVELKDQIISEGFRPSTGSTGVGANYGVGVYLSTDSSA